MSKQDGKLMIRDFLKQVKKQATREEILAMKPGIELDELVAEHVLAWRSMKGPDFDYHGPCKSNDVLIPPFMSEEEALRFMPSKGEITSHFFVNRSYSKNLSAAWEVEEQIKELGLTVEYTGALKQVVLGTGEYVGMFDFIHATPEQRCKAALLAVIGGSGNE